MSSEDAPTRSKLFLKGSAKIIAEFFEYSLNSILFQRGIYPAEDFTIVKKYGINMLVSVDSDVKSYIRKIISQINKWMVVGKISKFVVTISSLDEGDIVERWQFNVNLLNNDTNLKANVTEGNKENKDFSNEKNGEQNLVKEKNLDEIQQEIQAIIRQITASVTFLPVLEGRYTFNVLAYTDSDAQVPSEWIDSDPKEINGAEQVKLRSFSTNSHKVDTLVSYRFGIYE